jgi:hypothetical protein
VSRDRWWRAAATVALAAACYGNTLANDFVWDDRLSAVAAADVGTVLGQRTGPYYRPVVMLSFVVDRAVWGTSAFGFHLTNLLAHAGVGILVGELALVLGATGGAALAASLLFVAHPVQTEAVSYVSGRTDVLCALFVLGALLVWRRARRAADGWAIASAALVLAALGCKETALLVPLVFLVPGAHPLTNSPSPWVPIAAAIVWAIGWALTAAPATELTGVGGRLPAVAAMGLEYARLLAWPSDLHLERFVVVPGRPLAMVAAQWATVMLLLAVLVRAASRVRGGSTALALALATYLPASGIVPVYPAIADRALFAAEHFLYLPLCALVPLLVVWAHRDLPDARVAAALVVVLLAAWMSLTIARNCDWRDEETLFTHTLRYDPPTARVWYDLGNLRLATGKPAEAERLYRAALVRDPRDAAIHLNLGIALQRQNRRVEAATYYEEALRLDPSLARAFQRPQSNEAPGESRRTPRP